MSVKNVSLTLLWKTVLPLFVFVRKKGVHIVDHGCSLKTEGSDVHVVVQIFPWLKKVSN